MIPLTQEQIDTRRQWAKALRSGKYEQGKGALHLGENLYCCLGVLCDVIDPNGWTIHGGTAVHQGKIGFPSNEVIERAGLEKQGGFARDLWMCNDVHGLTFEQIADLIDRDTLARQEVRDEQ